MRALTANEIRFIKETKITPEVILGDEWDYTMCANLQEAEFLAETEYDIDLLALCNAICPECDSISLEYDATYLFYSFFTLDELKEMTSKSAITWLQNFKYWGGYRKYDENLAYSNLQDAIEIYCGTREFYVTEDGDMWNRSID